MVKCDTLAHKKQTMNDLESLGDIIKIIIVISKFGMGLQTWFSRSQFLTNNQDHETGMPL